MEIQIAVAKVPRHGAAVGSESLEVIETANGGLSVVMADGLAAGPAGKTVSMLVVHKVIGMLAEGWRDAAAAQAAARLLFEEKNGQAASTLNLLTVDPQAGTLILTRNDPTPYLLARNDDVACIDTPSGWIGAAAEIQAAIRETRLEPGLTLLLVSDGLYQAGEKHGRRMDASTSLQAMLEDQQPAPQEIADSLLNEALRLEDGRPGDDLSVVVLRVTEARRDATRRMTVRLPLRGED